MPQRDQDFGNLIGRQDGATDAMPLQRRVYERIASAILNGSLRPGDRLPSTRELARTLRIGRNTVSWAFEQLTIEGYVETRRGSGTYVSARLGDFDGRAGTGAVREEGGGAKGRMAERASRYADVAASLQQPQEPVPFRMNMPAVDEFPFALWRRLMKGLMSQGEIGARHLLGEVEPAGYGPLREAVAQYLSLNRGVICTPDQVLIVAGAQQGLDIAARLLLDVGERAMCEDPGFPGCVAALRACGAEVSPVPVDSEGFDVDRGREMYPDARLAVVCPSSQFPLGHTMSLSRRLALIEWSKACDGWIIEDDYDSEFRYRGQPGRSLQGLDGGSRVVYIGTFSKVLFPGLRLGYVVVPQPHVDLFVNARIVSGRQSPTLEQVIVERFISDGHLGRHIARMRRLYAARQAALVQAFRETFDGTIRLQPSETGLQMIGWLPTGWDDAEISQLAKAEGLEITPLSRLTFARRMHPALLLGFGNFRPEAIADGARRLRRVVEAYSAAR